MPVESLIHPIRFRLGLSCEPWIQPEFGLWAVPPDAAPEELRLAKNRQNEPVHTPLMVFSSHNRVKLSQSPGRAGWYMIELHCDASTQAHTTLFHVELNGSSRAYPMSLKPGKMSKRLIWWPGPDARLTWQPLLGTGYVHLNSLAVVWVPRGFAVKRQFARLAVADEALRDRPVASLCREFRRQYGHTWRRELQAQYDALFQPLHQVDSYKSWIQAREQPGPGEVPVTPSGYFRLGYLILCDRTDLHGLQSTLDSLRANRGDWQAWVLLPQDVLAARPPAFLQAPANVHWLGQSGEHWPIDPALLDQVAAGVEAVSVLRAGDRIASDMPERVIAAFARSADITVVYTDEDRLDKAGQRCSPRFKPQPNVDGMLTRPWLGRAVLVRASLLADWAQARPQTLVMEQDWAALPLELALHEMLQKQGEQRLYHLPYIGLHRASPQAHTRAVFARAVKAVLSVNEQPARVDHFDEQAKALRLHWAVPKPAPLVSLIIPTRDMLSVLRPCVETILGLTHYLNYEILIVDNNSREAATHNYLADVQARDSRVRVLRWHKAFNYSAINNYAARAAKGSLLALVNNDVEPINAGWLHEMVAQALRDDIGCVGAKLYYPNNTIQHGGVVLGLGGVAGHAHRFFRRNDLGYMGRLQTTHNVSAVTGACLVVRKHLFDQLGGLNEESLPVAFNDVDFCLRVREAGYRNLWTPYAELYHHESITRQTDTSLSRRRMAQRESDYMRRTWGELLDNDPAYNPNLTLLYEDFSLR